MMYNLMKVIKSYDDSKMIAKKETARRNSWKGNDDLHVNKHVYR